MVTIAKDSGGREFEPVPQGTHAAVCDMVVDMGIQDGGQYAPKHKVYLRWQIPGERVEFEKDGEKVNKPAVIGRTLTLSLSEKGNLRPMLEAWRGRRFTAEELRGFDVSSVLGKACMLNVVHEDKGGKTYANIAGLLAMPKGIPTPRLDGDPVLYDDDNRDSWNNLRPWMQEKITGQLNSRDAVQAPSPTAQANKMAYADLDDDIPF